ncbi:MAG: periplasmic heavy metal sensor [Janthinobacterium lividum]
MLKKRLTLAISTAAMALSMATAPVVFAAPAAPPPASDSAPSGHWQHRHGPGGFLKRLDALHAQLGLNPQQEQLWQKAVASLRQTHSETRALREDAGTRMHALLQQPVLDLAALRDARLQNHQRAQQLRKQSDDAWLEAYNSLDTRQKTIVSDAIRRELRHHWWHKHHGGWGDHHGGWGHHHGRWGDHGSGGGDHRDGRPDDAGTPPTPASAP